jgi:PPK2 family polyphosphate:nucleotide phosphotransferase
MKDKSFFPPEKKSIAKISSSGGDYCELNDQELEVDFQELSDELNTLQELIFAESRHKVLIVLQGLDTSGKDGTVKHVFGATNPQGVRVISFKKPTDLESRHDYLWRVHRETPEQGEMVIFNRSHYEDVIVPTVHQTQSKKQIANRIHDINAFEKMLVNEGVTLLKFFLHISHKEQAQRIAERLDNPKKHWKFQLSDLTERQLWNQYQEAYDQIIKATHHKDRPWFIIPADNKKLRNYFISSILVHRLQALNPTLPSFDKKLLRKIKSEAIAMLGPHGLGSK